MKYNLKLEIDLDIELDNIKNNSLDKSVDTYFVQQHLEKTLKESIKNLLECESLRHFNASEDPTKVESIQYTSKVKYVWLVKESI